MSSTRGDCERVEASVKRTHGILPLAAPDRSTYDREYEVGPPHASEHSRHAVIRGQEEDELRIAVRKQSNDGWPAVRGAPILFSVDDSSTDTHQDAVACRADAFPHIQVPDADVRDETGTMIDIASERTRFPVDY